MPDRGGDITKNDIKLLRLLLSVDADAVERISIEQGSLDRLSDLIKKHFALVH